MSWVGISDSGQHDNNLIFAIRVPGQAEIAPSQLLFGIAVGSPFPAAELCCSTG